MERFEYMNNYTGEIYRNLRHAARAIIYDMIHFPACRTFKMFSLTKLDE